MGAETYAAFQMLLMTSKDSSNPHMRDIFFPVSGSACSPSDVNSFDFKVEVDSKCWENTHPDNLQVYVFNHWVERHPGGADKITKFADVQKTWFLTFPGWHGMGR
jgi:hypothetical protein